MSSSFSRAVICEETRKSPYPTRVRVASTPEEVERTLLRRVMRASVEDAKRVCAEKGSWVALSDDIV